ncbi:MAG: hypothetical protein K9I84_10780 [Leadbetterella sp.]|nr:hypothetical protein [Leadbetterella sp.]
MSNRFAFMFFFMILIANFFFLEKMEPSDYQAYQDKLLSLFLFQFDYFLLYVYVTIKFVKNPIWPLFWLGFVYGSLFIMGMSSIVITDEKEFEVLYSYIQPVLRLIIIVIFVNIGLERITYISKTNAFLLALGLIAGLYFLILLHTYPRPVMWSFYFYWLVLLSFLMVGILVKFPKTTLLFSIGLMGVFVSDLYYILPPEVRYYELTYLYIRIINTIGEYLIVSYVLNYYISLKSSSSVSA